MPKISIITVTFNAEDAIGSTMSSVAEQEFKDYEHIIVDGGSKDRTLEIVSKEGNELTSLHSKKDNGIYHGMNRGLKYAEGDYVIFLNAGDKFATPGTLEKYAEAIEDGYDIIYGDTVIIDKDGRILRPRHLWAPKLLTSESFSNGMLICHQAFMVRRKLAPKYSKEFKFSADYDWTINCIKNTTSQKCFNLNEVTIHYLDEGTTEKHKLESLRERFRIMANHYGYFRALFKHLLFIPRALKGKISKIKKR